MANVAKNAILRAKIEGIITDIMVKTTAAQVYMDDTTTLASYVDTLAAQADLDALQQTVEALGALAQKDKISESDLDEALAALIGSKAAQSDLDALAGRVTTLIGEDAGKSARTIANEELAKQLVPEGAKESLDTLAEIAAWIQDHPDDAAAMNAAITALQKQMTGIDAGEGTVKKYVDDAITALKIGDYAKAADLTALAGRVTALETGKADKATTLEGYGITDAYTDAQVDQKIADAVANATGGESAASVKAALEAYQTSNNARLTELEAKKHEHANKDVLDGISSENVNAWNGKANIYYSATEPAGMTENDLWVQLVD